MGKGFLADVGHGLRMAATGTVTAIAETGKGIYHAPDNIATAVSSDKPKDYLLDEEVDDAKALRVTLDAERDERRKTVGKSSGTQDESAEKKIVVDSKYYDILGVTPDASKGDIRRAYYKLARENHPDKHPEDDHAKEKFQEVGEAYQVLGDDERRKAYDAGGIDATNEVPLIDNALFFAMLFGSDELGAYVGQLQLTQVVEVAEDFEGCPDEEMKKYLKHIQHAREVELAVLLRERLAPYHLDEEKEKREAWHQAMRCEVKKLCEASFGYALVDAIGWIYVNRADHYIGKSGFLGMAGAWADFQQSNRSLNSRIDVASAASKTSSSARRVSHAKKREEMEGKHGRDLEAQKARLDQQIHSEEVLQNTLTTILNVCIVDIEETVSVVCKKVLSDHSIGSNTRKVRAEALRDLGKIMQEEAKIKREASKDEKIDARQHMESAFEKAAEKTHHHETADKTEAKAHEKTQEARSGC